MLRFDIVIFLLSVDLGGFSFYFLILYYDTYFFSLGLIITILILNPSSSLLQSKLASKSVFYQLGDCSGFQSLWDRWTLFGTGFLSFFSWYPDILICVIIAWYHIWYCRSLFGTCHHSRQFTRISIDISSYFHFINEGFSSFTTRWSLFFSGTWSRSSWNGVHQRIPLRCSYQVKHYSKLLWKSKCCSYQVCDLKWQTWHKCDDDYENENFRSATSLFSTLPISVAAPGLDGDHMLLDMVRYWQQCFNRDIMIMIRNCFQYASY